VFMKGESAWRRSLLSAAPRHARHSASTCYPHEHARALLLLPTTPTAGCVDLGVVTFKTTLLEETGFRFAVDRLRTVPPGQQPPKEMFAGECVRRLRAKGG
jgi:hypothetical protein